MPFSAARRHKRCYARAIAWATKGEIWPVHPKKTEILGRKVYRSVQELPGSPDAAYVGVNRHLTIDIVRDLAARGAGGAICYATGFTEAGEEGAEP